MKASDSYRIHNLDSGLSYTTIQAAINARETIDGDTILVDEGIYYEHVVINKSIELVGTDWSRTVIDGNTTGEAIFINADNVTVREFTVRRGVYGILAERSDRLTVVRINASHNVDGIHVRYSSNITIHQSVAEYNEKRGIFITNSNDFVVSNNHVYRGGAFWYGLNVNASVNGLISFNEVYENGYDGIGLSKGSNNTVVAGNTVHDNTVYGVWLQVESQGNFLYHNNIFNNSPNAAAISPNSWNNSVEGNYWGDYVGADNNGDGIGDSAYVIDADNVDHKPLVGMYSGFKAYGSYEVDVVSNSSISDFEYLRTEANRKIKMLVLNRTVAQTFGFCRIRIPYALMQPPFNVTIDEASPTYVNYPLWDDGESRWIYFAYNHSMRQVLIEGIMPLDTTTPRIIVESPRSRVYPISDVRLVFSVDEPSSWIGYSLDFEANVTASGNLTLTDLSDGSHSIVVYANDTAGNTGKSATIYFSIDTSPPNVSIISPQNKTYTTDTVFLNFTVDEPTVWIGYKLDANETVVIDGNTTISELSDGVHSLAVYAEDLFGHVGVSETVVFSVDTEAEELEAEPFPIWGVAAIIAVIGVCLIGVYFLKSKKSVSKS